MFRQSLLILPIFGNTLIIREDEYQEIQPEAQVDKPQTPRSVQLEHIDKLKAEKHSPFEWHNHIEQEQGVEK